MQRTFEVISDAGHGWAKVPLSVIAALGMNRKDFTLFSYLRFDTKRGRFADVIYLEEDCDLSKFVQAYTAKTGSEPQWRERLCDRARLRTGRNYYSNVQDSSLDKWFAAEAVA